MYSGFTISGSFANTSHTLTSAFEHVMKIFFSASITDNDDALTASYLWGNLQCYYEFKLTTSEENGTFTLDAWGLSNDIDIDDSLEKLIPLSVEMNVESLVATLKTREMGSTDVIDHPLDIPQTWF